MKDLTPIARYDVRGILVTTVEMVNGAGAWDSSNAPAGTYFARAAGGDAPAVKFIKM